MDIRGRKWVSFVALRTIATERAVCLANSRSPCKFPLRKRPSRVLEKLHSELTERNRSTCCKSHSGGGTCPLQLPGVLPVNGIQSSLETAPGWKEPFGSGHISFPRPASNDWLIPRERRDTKAWPLCPNLGQLWRVIPGPELHAGLTETFVMAISQLTFPSAQSCFLFSSHRHWS